MYMSNYSLKEGFFYSKVLSDSKLRNCEKKIVKL
jgi:hypothetical protein